jgi:hypothetical protein
MQSKLQKTTALPMPSALEQTSTQAGLWQLIALTAYLKAEARGFNPGHELDDWLEAERELAVAMIDEELAA